MDETGSMSELERRLRVKAEEDRRRSQKIYLAELSKLGESLRRRVSAEHNTIIGAMEPLTRGLAVTLRRLSFLAVVLGALLALGIFGANWALMQWQSSQIKSLKDERLRLQKQIAEQRLTVQRLQDQTWGVWLVEGSHGRFVILPKGTLSNPAWTWTGGFPAVRLSKK